MRSLGVIGHGVVGGAVAGGFKRKGYQVFIYDKYKPHLGSFKEVLIADMIFVCAPSPTNDEGVQDLSALTEILHKLSMANYGGVIVVKSTVLPGTTERLAKTYNLTKVCHNPEFLTAAHPLEDFLNQTAVLIGGPISSAVDVGDLYFEAGFTNVQLRNSATYTEMAKYAHNVMLAARVNMANEFFERCKVVGIDYSKMIALAKAIGQIGHTHLAVPGPDGKYGFGGMCFPKDTKALYQWDCENKVVAEELEAIIHANERRRPEEN